MKRQFLKHGLAYGGANAIAGLSTILLVPVYTRTLPPSDYGVVDFVAAMQVLVQICAGLEMTQGLARFYAGAGSDQERQAYASTGLIFLLGSFAVVCASLYLAARLFGGQFLGIAEQSPVLWLALLSIYARILFYALQSQARWELRSNLYSLASVVAVTCTVAAVSYLLLVARLGLGGVFAGLGIGYGAGCLFCLVALRHTYRPTFDADKFQQMLRFSAPLAISSLAIFLASYGDRIIVRSVLGFHDLGIYGIGARVAAVITIVINGFQLGAAPLIYRHYEEPGTPAALAQLMRLFLAAGLLGVVGLASFSIELLTLFTTPEYAAAWRVVPVLALAIVLASLYIFVPGLSVRNMTGRFALVSVATAGVSLLLVAVCLRLFGVVGAALGSLGGAAAGFAMHARFSQQVYRMPLEWRRIGGGLLITVLAIGGSWMLGAPGAVSFVLRLLLFGVSSVLLVELLSTRQERDLLQRAVASRAISPWSAA
jgi:O-antigen/teichoic acid export membrane protein